MVKVTEQEQPADSNIKRVLLCVTGSIAAYKACELTRELVKANVEVRVLMTLNATRFVTPLTFAVLSGHPVYSNEWEQGMIHIDARNAADLLLVAPATANSIAKFANGIADDVVSSTWLAARCPRLVAPAMNPAMWQNAATRRNMDQLQADGAEIVAPGSGNVICGDIGEGRLADLQQIVRLVLDRLG
ncbi:MAG: phosphopantothenoylcysteine decarboxylase [Leptospiraceae bacterium]|nr:phosphopantothenoylcysteine decarboxylase [Leptospiraceae bacterium]